MFGTVPVTQIPVYVANKAISLLALGLIGASLVVGPLARGGRAELSGWLATPRGLGLLSAALALLHVLLSLSILTPAYFAKLHAPAGGGLTLGGELALLTGALAATALVGQTAVSLRPAADAQPPALPSRAALRRLGWAVLLLTGLHCGFLGWPGWLTPGAWPGGLPPITLLAVVYVLVVARVRLLRRGRGPE